MKELNTTGEGLWAGKYPTLAKSLYMEYGWNFGPLLFHYRYLIMTSRRSHLQGGPNLEHIEKEDIQSMRLLHDSSRLEVPRSDSGSPPVTLKGPILGANKSAGSWHPHVCFGWGLVQWRTAGLRKKQIR